MDPIDRLPPHSLEAEQALLGSLLIDRDAIALVVDSVQPEMFYHGANGTIYKAISALWSARKPADFVVLCDFLTAKSALDAVGGVAYLSSLVTAVPTAVHVGYYGRIVVEKARRRALIDAGSKIVSAAYREEVEVEPDDAIGIIRRAAEPFKSEAVGDGGLFAATMVEHQDGVEARWNGEIVDAVMPTGIPSVDRSLYGGFRPGELVFVGGRPGSGKTSWMLQLAIRAARLTGKRSLVVELEMSAEALRNRAIAAESGVAFGVAYDKVGDIWLRDNWRAGADRLASVPVDIQRLSTTDRIISYAETAMASEFPVGAVFVDHLDYLKDRVAGDSAEQRTAQLTRACKRIATDLAVPVIVLSQLNREVEAHSPFTPSLKHFRQSGAIEQDADHAFLLYRRKYYVDKHMLEPDESKDFIRASPMHRVELIMAKNRNGEVRSFELGWQPETMSFREVAAA